MQGRCAINHHTVVDRYHTFGGIYWTRIEDRVEQVPYWSVRPHGFTTQTDCREETKFR